jgi:hypothetical protein
VRGLIHAPGERYVVAHRPRSTPSGLSQSSTGCDLAIGDGWEILPPELSTPICVQCTDSLRGPSQEATPAPEPAAASTAPSPSTVAPTTAQEPPQPPPDPAAEEPPQLPDAPQEPLQAAPKEPTSRETWARIRRFLADFTRSRTER